MKCMTFVDQIKFRYRKSTVNFLIQACTLNDNNEIGRERLCSCSDLVAMARGREVSPFTRGKIVAYAQNGQSAKRIAALLHLPRRTVSNLMLKARNGNLKSRRENCGRKLVFGSRTVHRIHRHIVSNPFASSRAIAADLQSESSPGPSPRTVRRILCDRLRLRGRRPAKKP